MALDDVKGVAGESDADDPVVRRLGALEAGFDVDLAGVGRRVTARHRRRAAVAVLATIVCVLAGGVVAVQSRNAGRQAASAAAVECPATLGSDAGPTLDASSTAEHGRLVPATAPLSAVLCSYSETSDPTPAPLIRYRQIRSGLNNLPDDLDLASASEGNLNQLPCPRSLPGYREPRQTLILRYPEQTLTLVEGSTCAFTLLSTATSSAVGPRGQRSFLESLVQGNRWVGASSVDASCSGTNWYRNAAGRTVSPGRPASIRVCDQRQGTNTLLDSRARAAVLKALSGATVSDLSGIQDCTSQDRVIPPAAYTLVLGYTDGPAMLVRIDQNCDDMTPWAPVVNTDSLLQVVKANS